MCRLGAPALRLISLYILIMMVHLTNYCCLCQVDDEEGGGAEAEGPQENGGSGKRKRRKLSLLANIMHDLGLNDSQKLGVLLVFAGIIILPRFFGFDTRPTSKYGDAMRRQKKYAKEKGKKNASKPKRRNEQKKKS